ncbi:MAG: tellurite resistance TerB C-terminal domain-containing protein, partial [Prevotella sp.]
HLDAIDFMNELSLYVMEHCYQTILPELFQQGFTCGGYEVGTGPRCLNEDTMFQLSQIGIQSYGIPPLFVNFPFLQKREVFVTSDLYLSVVRGVLAAFQVKLSKSSLYMVQYYFELLAEVVIFLIGGPQEALVDYKAILKRNMYRKDYYTVKIKDQKVLLSVVSHWLKQRPYLLKSYQKSVSEVKKEMQISSFSVDVHRLDTIRTASMRTQEKLIVEEKEVEAKPEKKRKKQPQKKVSPSVAKKVSSAPVQKDSVPQSQISFLCNELYVQLSSDEWSVFKEIVKKNIKKAMKLCREKNLLISVVIEKINTIAIEVLEDVIIEDNEVLCDYRDEIVAEVL